MVNTIQKNVWGERISQFLAGLAIPLVVAVFSGIAIAYITNLIYSASPTTAIVLFFGGSVIPVSVAVWLSKRSKNNASYFGFAVSYGLVGWVYALTIIGMYKLGIV